jgi:hypothetical protein
LHNRWRYHPTSLPRFSHSFVGYRGIESQAHEGR